MYKTYKKTTAALYIVGILGPTALILDGLRRNAFSRGIVNGFIILLVCTVVYFLAIAYQENKKTQLIANCRPRDFIAHGEKILSDIADIAGKNNYCINLYVAYRDLDDRKKAEEYLMQVKLPFPKGSSGKMMEYIWHIDKCACCMEADDLENAERELAAAEAILADTKLNSAVRENMFRTSQAQRYAMNMQQGNYDGAEIFFLNYYGVEKTLRGKVFAQLNLAEIYRHFGETEKARQAAMYVAQNGGQTCYVKKAQDWLLEMQ